ncbi:MAG TPA: phytanoyl-CoA dioxygenase [Verrucomicrobiales bacterium]|nr:phytanoyl-CoA dioxygenase [Verrucomicrobiales bacterium]
MIHPLDQQGVCMLPDCVTTTRRQALDLELANVEVEGAGRRNLIFDSQFIRDFASGELAALLKQFSPEHHFPVRALLFDKTPQTNWTVSWHQDLSIAVADRIDTPGFGGWSLKEGVWHVQPPATVLERMLTVRLHLDDCGPEHGPLRVVPGSHRLGRLDADAIAGCRAGTPVEEILCGAGDALVMRPLLLHASSKATRPSRRRVLHVEFAREDLPGDLEWAAATSPHRQPVFALAGGRS